MQSKFRKSLVLIICAIFITAILFFLLRGPYLSNSIKRVIIPVLENTTKGKIIIDKAVINLFPFYIQAKGLKMFDKDGNKLLWITKSRAYIDLTGILLKELRIKKLTINEPDLIADEASFKQIIENIKKSTSGEGNKQYKISIRNIELTNGTLDFKNTNGLTFSAEGLFFEMTTKNDVTAQMKLNKGTVKTRDHTIISGALDGSMKIADKGIEITAMNVYSSQSRLKAKGVMHFTSEGDLQDGSFSGNATIYEDIIHKLFRLKTEKDGVLSFDGSVNMTMDKALKQPQVTVDLKTESRIYLETLMDILKVKENISGKLSVKGRITGTFPEFSGSGTAKLEDAVLDTFHLDDAVGEFTYGNKKFSLKNFTAHTYEGEMKGEASLSLPHGDYTVDADIARISSPKFLKFIKWEPPFQPGEVSGHFQLQHNHGQDIEVRANVNYLNTSGNEGDVLNRLHTIKGNLHLKDSLLTLNNSVLSTSVSDLALDGDIDLKKSIMNLDVRLDSGDVSDLTLPYYTKLIAQGRFKGTAKGPLDDPEISGRFEAGSGSVHGLMFTNASADLIYKISSLFVRKLNITDGGSSYDASGTIEFRNAKGLFYFSEPFFRAQAAVKDVDIKPFVKVLYKDVPVSGSASGLLSFEGDLKSFTAKGDLLVKDSTVYEQELEKVIVKTTIRPKDIEFNSITAQKGDSILDARGNLSFDKRFNFSISSSKLNLSDINMLRRFQAVGSTRLNVKGSGTFEKPDINYSVEVLESSYRGVRMGKGKIEGLLKDNNLSAQGSFMNGIIAANAKAILSKKILWNIDIDFYKGSYDLLLAGLVKNLPEDLELSLEGKIKIKGEGENVSLLFARFGYLNCNLYGYSLRNSNDIILELVDKRFVIKAFSLTGDNAKISAEGVLKLNEQFDLKINGNLNLAQFKNLPDKIVSLKGNGNFIANITGPWDRPDITGEVNVKDAMVLLNENPYKVGPMNGTIYLRKDRFTFDSVKTGFGGGSVIMSGVGYLKGFTIQRIFISSEISGINIKPLERVSATVDGKLFYETSEKGSKIYGNIEIKKAKYEKKTELNQWLISLRQINRDTLSYPAFLKDTEFNVYLSGSDNIIINNNIAKTPVKIALTLTGNVSRFGLIGRVEADEGTVYFRSNEFKILEGSNVDFITSNKIVPFFHILAETYIGNYYIKMNIDGTIDKFTLSLFSDPPLSEMEILTLLTIGQTGKESRGFETGIATSEAASILTGGLQDVVQEQIKDITGFERFMIEPHTTSAGAVGTKVTIGKRLLEDKLFVTYSTSVGTTEESVLRLEYILDKNFSLVGSKDEIGSVGGDIKFRFEFK